MASFHIDCGGSQNPPFAGLLGGTRPAFGFWSRDHIFQVALRVVFDFGRSRGKFSNAYGRSASDVAYIQRFPFAGRSRYADFYPDFCRGLVCAFYPNSDLDRFYSVPLAGKFRDQY